MARTDGLADFGYPDVCVFNTHQEPEALYQQLYLMAIEEIDLAAESEYFRSLGLLGSHGGEPLRSV